MPPKNPAHQPIYEQLKQLRFLEKLQQFLTPFRLPRALLVKVEGCDGDANAFYEKDTITVYCEYIEQLRKTMPAETTVAGVTSVDAVVGPLFDTCLHEFAHARNAGGAGPSPGQRDPHWPVVGRLHLLGAEPAAVHHRAGGEEDLLAGFRQGRGGRDPHGE